MKEILSSFLNRKIKEKNLENPKIIADYRERGGMVISEVNSLGIETEIKELKVGDYIIRGVAIERKTVFDFISSMKSGRLLRQLEELKQYENRLLIIEGIDEQDLYTDSTLEDGKPVGMHPNSIRGFLLSILLNYKTPIIFTKDYKDTARFFLVLSKQEPREVPLNVKKKVHNKEEQSRYILEGFPGIGPKTAKKLIKRFKTIKGVIDAPEDEIKKEIGKKAENLIRIINNKS